jgi:hypothetical protein
LLLLMLLQRAQLVPENISRRHTRGKGRLLLLVLLLLPSCTHASSY